MKRRRALLLILALSAALVAAVVGLRRPYAWFLARHWGNRLETVPEERVDVLLEGIVRLGDPGIPVLVEALGSERPSVAGGARGVLAKEMRRWESLRASEYTPKLAILAQALADRVDRLHPAARAQAADLATEILSLWTLDEAVVDPAEVIASCEKVLRMPTPRRPMLAQRPSREQLADGRAAIAPPPGGGNPLRAGPYQAGTAGEESALPLADLGSSPGDQPPAEPTEAPGLHANPFRGPHLADRQLAEPRRLDGAGASLSVRHPLRTLSEPENAARLRERSSRPAGETESTDVPRVRPLQFLSDGAGPSLDVPGVGFDARDPATLDTVALMRRLQATDNETAAGARTELVRRGFDEVRLALARQLFHPDPAVRARLGRVLLGLPNVDAVPWLLELSRDEDPEVRLAAMALMATTGDPTLLKAIENNARQDPDPRVQQQAERIAGRQRSAGY